MKSATNPNFAGERMDRNMHKENRREVKNPGIQLAAEQSRELDREGDPSEKLG